MRLTAAEKIADLKISAGYHSEHWHEWRDLQDPQMARFRAKLVATFERIPQQQMTAKLRTFYRLHQFAESPQLQTVHSMPSYLLAEFLSSEQAKGATVPLAHLASLS
eukprot:12393087-Karenia_brevis.AAC.1